MAGADCHVSRRRRSDSERSCRILQIVLIATAAKYLGPLDLERSLLYLLSENLMDLY